MAYLIFAITVSLSGGLYALSSEQLLEHSPSREAMGLALGKQTPTAEAAFGRF